MPWVNVDVTHRLLLRIVAVAACVLPILAAPGSAGADPALETGGAPAIVVPAGVTAAVAVYDRTTGAFTEQRDTARQVRAASVVKLLIALDLLQRTSTNSDEVENDITAMLTRSDDAVASRLGQHDDVGLGRLPHLPPHRRRTRG